MSESPGAARTGMVVRLSVPAASGLRVVAADMARKVTEHLGVAVPDAEPVADAIEQLAGRVAPQGLDAVIDFEFSRSGNELLIEARCKDKASELRYPLPA